MKPSEQTMAQIERFINKISEKYPYGDDVCVMTDIHLRVSQDTGDLFAFDDDDNEITRCVVEQWINCKDEHFYHYVTMIMRNELEKLSATTDCLGILKPYSFVLENDDREHISELYVVDDDTIILGGDLMEGLEKDLDDFLNGLFKE